MDIKTVKYLGNLFENNKSIVFEHVCVNGDVKPAKKIYIKYDNSNYYVQVYKKNGWRKDLRWERININTKEKINYIKLENIEGEWYIPFGNHLVKLTDIKPGQRAKISPHSCSPEGRPKRTSAYLTFPPI